jgi:AraC-like DNA-binding protein
MSSCYAFAGYAGPRRSPVTEVCFASGFGSLARFYATFKEAFGVAPGAYRAHYGRA